MGILTSPQLCSTAVEFFPRGSPLCYSKQQFRVPGLAGSLGGVEEKGTARGLHVWVLGSSRHGLGRSGKERAELLTDRDLAQLGFCSILPERAQTRSEGVLGTSGLRPLSAGGCMDSKCTTIKGHLWLVL